MPVEREKAENEKLDIVENDRGEQTVNSCTGSHVKLSAVDFA